jgi:hypothetical protein
MTIKSRQLTVLCRREIKRMTRINCGQWISTGREPSNLSISYKDNPTWSNSWLLLHITQTKRNNRRSYGKGIKASRIPKK